MTWTGTQGSHIFSQSMKNPLLRSIDPTNITLPTGYTDLVTDTSVMVALFGNTGTPNQADTMAHIGYNATGGQWVTANESSATGYTAGGSALASRAFGIDATTGASCFSANNVTWTITAGTLTAYGDLVYDSAITGGTILDQGMCFNFFGGVQTLTGSAGATFTVAWPTVGAIGSGSSGVIFDVSI
jgi:hypothetical protein